MHFRGSNFKNFLGGACPQTSLEAQALRAFAYMAYGHVIHVTGDI